MTENETTKSSKFATAKTLAHIVAVRASSGVVVTLVHQNLDTTDFTRLQKASVYVGAYLIGSMVADAAAEHLTKKFDMIVEAVAETKKNFEDSKTVINTTN